jgi:hypothetical protein
MQSRAQHYKFAFITERIIYLVQKYCGLSPTRVLSVKQCTNYVYGKALPRGLTGHRKTDD